MFLGYHERGNGRIERKEVIWQRLIRNRILDELIVSGKRALRRFLHLRSTRHDDSLNFHELDLDPIKSSCGLDEIMHEACQIAHGNWLLQGAQSQTSPRTSFLPHQERGRWDSHVCPGAKL